MASYHRERSIPLSVYLNLFLGSREHISGWWFMGVTMLFMWLFIPNVDYSIFYLWGDVTQVEGEITGFTEITTPILENDWYENSYTFFTPEGQQLNDFSYSQSVGKSAGQPVTVVYPAGKPYLSKIEGMSRDTLSPLYLFFLLIPGIGLLSIIIGVVISFRMASLLRKGNIAEAELISHTSESTAETNTPLTKLTFAFEDQRGERVKFTYETANPKELMDEKTELVLYPPDNPEKAMLLDSVPTKILVDDKGRVTLQSHKRTIVGIVVPIILIFIHLAIAQYFFHFYP